MLFTLFKYIQIKSTGLSNFDKFLLKCLLLLPITLIFGLVFTYIVYLNTGYNDSFISMSLFFVLCNVIGNMVIKWDIEEEATIKSTYPFLSNVLLMLVLYKYGLSTGSISVATYWLIIVLTNIIMGYVAYKIRKELLS